MITIHQISDNPQDAASTLRGAAETGHSLLLMPQPALAIARILEQGGAAWSIAARGSVIRDAQTLRGFRSRMRAEQEAAATQP